MATGYTVAGRGDLDTIFKARTGTAAAATGFLSNGGVDLAQRFEQRGATTAVADTGFRKAGADLATIFQSLSAVSNTITISNMYADDERTSGTAIAQYQLTNAGEIMATEQNFGLLDRGDWLTPKSNFSLYSSRATIVNGSLTTGNVGVWENLATTRTWTVSSATLKECAFLIEIRSDADGIVRDSATITLHAERT